MGRFDLRTRNGLISPIIQGLQVVDFLLDLYPSATVAYSLRLLRSTYSGKSIRVRRSSDNTEQDIGFNNIGSLDTSDLLTFCNGSNGFVTRFYDQSGQGNNGVQTTAINQPIIVSAGALITRNGKPYIQSSSTQWLSLTTDISTPTGSSYSIWMTYEKDTSGNQAIILKNGDNYHWLEYGTFPAIANADNVTISSAYNINTLYLHNTITNYSVSGTIYRNGVSIGSRGALTSAAISRDLPSASFRSAKITMAEFIFYPFTQTTNKTKIDEIINNYYAIY